MGVLPSKRQFDPGAPRFIDPVTAMSLLTYAASFLFAWIAMVVLLGLALRRCLRERGGHNV